jgi:peptidoglycan/xylan/chitin deacetylase (PgdA/CDA1 family)
VIGEEAQNNIGLLRRYVREGHEIGNHTFTHPDISEISARQLELELNWTERLFAAETGIQPLYFRPPYSIDQEPDTNDEAAPAYRIQQMGYTIIGDKIDTDDWNEHPRKSPQGDHGQRAAAAGRDEDASVDAGQHRPAARWGREPRADSSGASTADYDAAGEGL